MSVGIESTDNVKASRKRLYLIPLGILLVIALIGIIPRTKNIKLPNGGRARVTAASLFRSLFNEANCEIEYEPTPGKRGTVVLWQDFFDGAIFLLPSTNANVLWCVYDYDVDLRLFKIDTGKLFTAPSAQDPINYILFSCTWDIQFGRAADWGEVLTYLRSVSIADYKKSRLPSSFRFANDTPQGILTFLKYQHIQ